MIQMSKYQNSFLLLKLNFKKVNQAFKVERNPIVVGHVAVQIVRVPSNQIQIQAELSISHLPRFHRHPHQKTFSFSCHHFIPHTLHPSPFLSFCWEMEVTLSACKSISSPSVPVAVSTLSFHSLITITIFIHSYAHIVPLL